LQQLVHHLMLEDVVELSGAYDQEQVIEALGQSDIFILPSLAEALPVVLMESQAMGLPAVATQVGSTDQIVLDGASGFLVEPGNVDALAGKLKYLLEHADQWAEMGWRGRQHVAEKFDINGLNDQLVAIYQRLLGMGRATPAERDVWG
jgi:colanic acid/amylovoran biosynthesis glycosyltransferase